MSDGVIYLTADFTGLAGTQTSATIERGTSATGPWTLIGEVELLSEVGVFYDTSAPLDTQVWYRWTGSPGDAVIIQGPYIEISDGTVLLKDPLRPWANLVLEFCETAQQALSAICAQGGPDLVWAGFGDFTRRADANLFDIYGAEMPADIYGRRKRLDGSLKIFSKTLVARDAVETLFTAGGPLQLQMPAVYGWPDAFLQPGDLVETYISKDQRRPYRVWDAPFTLVGQPFGPAQGTDCANWCAVAEEFPTYADLTASGFTWAQVASGEAVCGDDVCVGEGYGECAYGDGPYGD
jgi:hypothetical protein